MGLAATTFRIGLGSMIVGHGLQKLAGKFGGPGLEGTAGFMEAIGMSPGRPYATAAALTETIGGGLLATGFLTPIGASMATGVMTVAIGKVHAKNGFWGQEGGYEYPLFVIASAFALTEQGPSFPALDGLITKKRKGFGWAAFELVAGVAAGVGVMALAGKTATSAGSDASSGSDVSDESDAGDSGPVEAAGNGAAPEADSGAITEPQAAD